MMQFPFAFRRSLGAGLAAACCLLAACAGTVSDLDDSGAVTIDTVRGRFEREKYYSAIEAAREFISLHPGSRHLDEATFLLARSEYEEGNFLEAEDRFRRLIRDFPQSEWAEDASYYLALSLLSQSSKPELQQSETEAAQIQFRSFIQRYPDSDYRERAEAHIADIRDRFGEKHYKNGETYRKIRGDKGNRDAARFYYEKVINSWPETQWAAKSMLRMAQFAQKEGRWEKAIEWSSRLVAAFPDEPIAVDGQRILDQSKEELVKEEELVRPPQDVP